MEIQLPESERRWLHAALVLGTLVLALVLIAQVSVILFFFSDLLLTLLLAWLLAFMLSPLVGILDRAFPKLPRVVVVGGVYLGMFVILSAIALIVAGNLAARSAASSASCQRSRRACPRSWRRSRTALDVAGLPGRRWYRRPRTCSTTWATSAATWFSR